MRASNIAPYSITCPSIRPWQYTIVQQNFQINLNLAPFLYHNGLESRLFLDVELQNSLGGELMVQGNSVEEQAIFKPINPTSPIANE